MILDGNVVEQEIAALNLPPNIVRLTQGRRAVLKFLAAQPLLLAGIPGTKPPLYIRKGADFKFHCTEGYPEVWQTVYRESLEHFAGKWGKVGPLHVFLIENSDWERKEAAKKKDATSPGAVVKAAAKEGRIKLRILVDRTSIETFVNDGEAALPCCFVPRNQETGLELYSTGGDARIHSLRVSKLRSIWGNNTTTSFVRLAVHGLG